MMSLTVHPFFEATSGSYGFIVANVDARCCAIIDAALAVQGSSTPLNTDTADLMLDWVDAHGCEVLWILDTHIHADRPSATGYLKAKLPGACTAIGANTPGVSGYDRLLREGDRIEIGDLCGRVMATPGHTPGCVSYQFETFVFVGDTLFMPDTGTARCDFPGGCAEVLYHSIQRLLALPGDTRLYVCHDYGGDGRRNRFVTTVAEELAQNVHVGCAGGSASDLDRFVALRQGRDQTLSPPRWVDVAVPANLQCMALRDIQFLVNQTRHERH